MRNDLRVWDALTRTWHSSLESFERFQVSWFCRARSFSFYFVVVSVANERRMLNELFDAYAQLQCPVNRHELHLMEVHRMATITTFSADASPETVKNSSPFSD